MVNVVTVNKGNNYLPRTPLKQERSSSFIFFLYTVSMPENFSDIELVQKTLKNPDQYALIIDRFEAPILRYLQRITGSSEQEVEDLWQMVFIKAYRSLNGFDTRLKFSSWLYRIAHNVGVDSLRKNARRNHTSLDAEDENNQALLEVLASDENIALNFSSEEQKKAVRSIIQSLPEKYKTVLVLSYLEDKSYDEISDILQMPINTVWTLISRAKKHFLAQTQEPQFSHLFHYVSTEV